LLVFAQLQKINIVTYKPTHWTENWRRIPRTRGRLHCSSRG